MLTGKIKNQIDQIWEAFWTGGVSNPLSVIEQISYLLFIRRLDELQLNQEREFNLTKKTIESPIFSEAEDELRWSKFKEKDSQTMFELMEKKVFPFIKNLQDKNSSFSKHMENAVFMIPKAALLVQVVDMIDGIDMKDRDTKGDVYEYLLSKIAKAGVNGQFRTPRHIIKMMVAMVKPTITDTICDPASGTCGFLMASVLYLRKHFANELLQSQHKAHFNQAMFSGFDFDAHMLRIGAMNMMLHGIENPQIEYRDSLSEVHDGNPLSDAYSIVLANPPFKGSVDIYSIAPDLLKAIGKTKPSKSPVAKVDKDGKKVKIPTEKSELLFLALIIRLLKAGGRAAVIVPDGVLFGSSNAHREIRKRLIDDQKLDAVISMPSGVFKPYAGVSTSILLFTKTNSGGTDAVWFYDMKADGFSLDDKRNSLVAEGEAITHELDNIPDILARWDNRTDELKRSRFEQSFFVPKAEIVENGYDLSINRYKETVHQEEVYDSPKDILTRLLALEDEIQSELKELEQMLN